MNVSAKGALYEVLYNHLNGASTIWGDRVEPLMEATAGLTKPCLVFFSASSGREHSVPVRDSERFTLTAKVVAATMQDAIDGQAALTTALHNSGQQDVNPRLPSHDEWHILTVTEDREVWLELPEDQTNERFYHAGHQYDILMERRAS